MTTLLLANFPSPAKAADITWTLRDVGAVNRPIQVALTGLPDVKNPFDPSQADLIATIEAPNGATLSEPMYWYQDYVVVSGLSQNPERAVGSPEWRVKFRSIATGTYRISVKAVINGSKIAVPDFSATTDYKSVDSIRAKDNYFVQGKDVFVPIAYNIAWASRYEELNRYERWFKAASEGGVNVARVWMASW